MIEIKTYTEKAITVEQIGLTFEAAFNQKFDAAYWNWRFLTNPFSPKIYIAYAMENGTLASYYAVSPIEVNEGNQTYLFALSNMTMTHPGYQGQGLFKALASKLYAELKSDGFDGVIGFANHNSHYGFRTHLGWHDLAALMQFQTEKPLPALKQSDSIAFEETEANIEGFENYGLSICSESDKISFSRRVDFLKWRLELIPSKNYRMLIQTEFGRPVSCTFFKIYGTGIDVMEHFQAESITESEKLRILSSVGYLQKLTGGTISLWSNLHSLEHLVLEKYGFKETAFSTYFGYIPFTKRSEALNNFKNWHFRFLDSDVF